MHHYLIDLDSTIPNLALMKISSWAKERGDTVSMNEMEKEPDHIWMSSIFTWNRKSAESLIRGLETEYPNAVLQYGGTGFDQGEAFGDPIRQYLPNEIEQAFPDYTLYADKIRTEKRWKDFDRTAVVFCQRGCNRKCQFCFVPRKEGRIDNNPYRRLITQVPDDFRKVLLLDNDIALAERWKFNEIMDDAHNMGVKLSITQGMDIREISKYPEIAQRLAGNKPWDTHFKRRTVYIAWDYFANESTVRKGIENLLEAGFKGEEIKCYIIVGFPDRTYQKSQEPYRYYEGRDLHRVEVLWKEYGVYSWVMPYNNVKTDQRLVDFERWVNKYLFKKMDFRDYRRGYKLSDGDLPEERVSVPVSDYEIEE